MQDCIGLTPKQPKHNIPPTLSLWNCCCPCVDAEGVAGDCGPAPVEDRGPGPLPDHDGEHHCGRPPDWVCDRDQLSFGPL